MSEYCKNCYKLTEQLEAENEKFKETVDGLLKIQYALAEHCNRYSQALSEIKEVAESEINNRMLFADKQSFYDFHFILQKISEVLEDDDTCPKEHWLFKD